MITFSGPGAATADYVIATLSDLTAYIKPLGTEDDTLLQLLLDGANRAFWADSGGRFLKIPASDWDVIMDGSGQRDLYLDQYPVTTVTSVASVLLTGNSTVQTLIAYETTDYQIVKSAGRLISVRWGAWPLGQENIRVRYKAGYGVMPLDLVNALCQWVAVTYARLKAKRLDIVSVSQGDESFQFTADDAPQAVRRVFDTYRRAEVTIG